MKSQFDNYSQNFTNYDKTTDFPCKKCGKLIDETQVFAEATEYEKEVEMCEDCFLESIGKKSTICL